MIDIHFHILPGIDDGPGTLAESVELARAAAAVGTRTIVATPHIREDYAVDPAALPGAAEAVNVALRAEGIALRIEPAGEVGITKAMELDDDTLAGLCLGAGPYLLIESPYIEAHEFLEDTLLSLQGRGFRPVVAHPERSVAFLDNLARARELAGRGILFSVTAGSFSGRFGNTVRRFAQELFREGLVHNVASDAHDLRLRPPGLMPAFQALEREFPAVLDCSSWYVTDVPAAMLAGEDLPPPPVAPRRRRLLGRR